MWPTNRPAQQGLAHFHGELHPRPARRINARAAIAKPAVADWRGHKGGLWCVACRLSHQATCGPYARCIAELFILSNKSSHSYISYVRDSAIRFEQQECMYVMVRFPRSEDHWILTPRCFHGHRILPANRCRYVGRGHLLPQPRASSTEYAALLALSVTA
jgi:hypothetical protein